MKEISMEEADKILAAHRPKDTNCPYCGVNLKNSHIPISKVKALIKHYEDDNERLKRSNFSSFMNNNDTRIQTLKELLPKED